MRKSAYLRHSLWQSAAYKLRRKSCWPSSAGSWKIEYQQEKDKEEENYRRKRSKKARKNEKKRGEEAKRKVEVQKEEEEQRERVRQEQDERTRWQRTQEQEQRAKKEEEERAREATAGADLKDSGYDAGFYCLLSGGALMTDPCIALDGYSYERQALVAHIAKAKGSGMPLLSPTTGQAMGGFYVTNHLLRSQLQAWLEEEGKKKASNGMEEEKIGDENEEKKEERC